MGGEQSSDSNARWRRTYASDFNAPRPAKRNLQNNTYILGTKFPTQSNWQQGRAKEQDQNKSNSQVVDRTSEVQAVRTDDKRKDTSLSGSASHSGGILAKSNTTFMGLSDEEFSKLKGVTETELSHHDKESDCWVAVSGVVLDVTAFLSTHPGGAGSLAGESGRDATNAFKRHPNLAKTEETLKMHVNSGIVKIVGRLMLKSEEKYKSKKSSKKSKKSKSDKRSRSKK